MEQRIEFFLDEQESPAISQGALKSEELYKEGWYVHDTCYHQETFRHESGNEDHISAMMITYRRNS